MIPDKPPNFHRIHIMTSFTMQNAFSLVLYTIILYKYVYLLCYLLPDSRLVVSGYRLAVN